LVVDAEDNDEIVSALLKQIRDLGAIVKVTVPDRHPLCRLGLSKVSSYSHEVPSPAIKLKGGGSFEEWLGAKSGSFRKGLRYDRRKLAEGADLRVFNGLQDPDLAQSMIAWQFEEKRRYLDRRGFETSWIKDDRCLALVKSLVQMAPPSATGVEVWALLAGGVPAAGAVCFVSRLSLELFMFVMNPDFSARSPGNLLIEDIARSAQERDLDFDFRITTESYKLRWAYGVVGYRTFVIALNLQGYPSVFRARFGRWMLLTRKFGKRQLVALQGKIARLRGGASRVATASA
jgi:CelD/BcsL family acetyltransferase involved in cellulose biosynthesis